MSITKRSFSISVYVLHEETKNSMMIIPLICIKFINILKIHNLTIFMELINSYRKAFKRNSKYDSVFRYHRKGLDGF